MKINIDKAHKELLDKMQQEQALGLDKYKDTKLKQWTKYLDGKGSSTTRNSTKSIGELMFSKTQNSFNAN
jgi:hypothetical protein